MDRSLARQANHRQAGLGVEIVFPKANMPIANENIHVSPPRAWDPSVRMDQPPEWSVARATPEARRRNREGQSIVARVAHELNNPIDGVLRYINLAIRQLGDDGDRKVLEYLTESREALMHVTRVTRDLLASARAHGNDAHWAEVADVVERAVRLMQPRANDNRVVITTCHRITGSHAVPSQKLYQVCCNLIQNALDAMPDGGRLMIDTSLVRHEAVLRFEDSGVGLPRDAGNIFEPFVTTRVTRGGTGLGLTICSECVSAMGGAITAYRTSNGSVFVVRIPNQGEGAIDDDGSSRLTN